MRLKPGFSKADYTEFKIQRFNKILKSFEMFLHASNIRVKNTK